MHTFNCVRIVDYVLVKVKRVPSFGRQNCRNEINNPFLECCQKHLGNILSFLPKTKHLFTLSQTLWVIIHWEFDKILSPAGQNKLPGSVSRLPLNKPLNKVYETAQNGPKRNINVIFYLHNQNSVTEQTFTALQDDFFFL